MIAWQMLFGNVSKMHAIPSGSSKLACSSRIASLPSPLPPPCHLLRPCRTATQMCETSHAPPLLPRPRLYLSIIQFLALTRSAYLGQSASQPQHPVRPHCTARQAIMHARHIRPLLFRYYATGAIVVSLAAGTYSSKFHPPYRPPPPPPCPRVTQPCQRCCIHVWTFFAACQWAQSGERLFAMFSLFNVTLRVHVCAIRLLLRRSLFPTTISYLTRLAAECVAGDAPLILSCLLNPCSRHLHLSLHVNSLRVFARSFLHLSPHCISGALPICGLVGFVVPDAVACKAAGA